MPSGKTREAGVQSAGTAELEAGLAQEDAGLGRAGAVLPTGAAAAGEALGRARSGAEAAMHPAATVGHGGLAAFAAAAGAGTATWCGQEVTGAVAVPQLTATAGRQAVPNRFRTMDHMPSGARAEQVGMSGGHRGLR
jgi:hypothetical protein